VVECFWYKHRLVFHRGTVLQGSVQPFLIIHILDEVGKSPLGIFHRLILPEIDLLSLECFHEALDHSVIVGITLAGHTDPELKCAQDVNVLVGRILHTPVRVMDDLTPKNHPLIILKRFFDSLSR